jgi:hypothetical protein
MLLVLAVSYVCYREYPASSSSGMVGIGGGGGAHKHTKKIPCAFLNLF